VTVHNYGDKFSVALCYQEIRDFAASYIGSATTLAGLGRVRLTFATDTGRLIDMRLNGKAIPVRLKKGTALAAMVERAQKLGREVVPLFNEKEGYVLFV
jgi:hypothetical protein